MMMIPFCIPYRPRGWHDHDCVCRIDEYRLSVSQSTEVQTPLCGWCGVTKHEE